MATVIPTLDPAYAAENKGPGDLAAMWVMMSLSLIAISARLYVRFFMQKSPHLDDYLMILSLLMGFLGLAFNQTAIYYGAGKHMAVLTLDDIQNIIKYTMFAFFPSVLSFTLPKIAVISFFARVLKPGPKHRAFLWFLGISLLVIMIATTGFLFCKCLPTYTIWDLTATGNYCYNPVYYTNWSYFVGAYSCFVDLWLAVYPALVLFKLQLPLKKKIALSLVLGLGSASFIVALYKEAIFEKLGDSDFSYQTTELSILTTLEGCLIMIASSFPALQPLVDKIAKDSWVSSLWNRSARSTDPSSNPSSANGSLEMGKKKQLSERNLYPDLDLTYQDRRGDSQDEILNKHDINARDGSFTTSETTIGNEKGERMDV